MAGFYRRHTGKRGLDRMLRNSQVVFHALFNVLDISSSAYAQEKGLQGAALPRSKGCGEQL
jgi:hypothetical protein